MSEQHQHRPEGKHTHDFRASSRKTLLIALTIIGTFFVIEAVGGFLTNSLALLADAGHLLTDVGAIALALLAIWFASRPFSNGRTYGYYRVEIFAALINGLTLWAIAGYIAFEAYQRFQDPPEVNSLPMLLVATGGFLAQTVTAFVLNRGTGESLNVRGAYLHVMTDAVQSVGVVISGILMLAFGWFIADPIISVLIALLIAWSGGRVAWEAVQVLMEHSPKRVNVDALCRRLEGLEGVAGVHDIHAWSITTGYEVLSAHVTVDITLVDDREQLLQHLREIASREFGIAHVTIQLEDSQEVCEEAHHIAHAIE